MYKQETTRIKYNHTAIRDFVSANPNWTHQEVADAIKIPATVVKRILAAKPGVPRKDSQEVREFVEANPGMSFKDIAHYLGVSGSFVSVSAKGVRPKHARAVKQ